MTDEQIIELAKKAGLGSILSHGGDPRVWIEGGDWHDELKRFAALVANVAANLENEACAKTCEELFQRVYPYMSYAEAAQDCADAIRSQGGLNE